MGYDMTIQHDGHLKGDADYFRLNIFGMSTYRQLMHAAGMIHSSRLAPGTEWPEWDSELAELDMDKAEFAHQVALKPLLTRHDSEIPTIPSHKLGSNDGWYVTAEEIRFALASYAFHEQDIKARLRASWEAKAAEREAPNRDPFRADPEGHPADWGTIEPDYWDEWIAWLRLAAQHAGFRFFCPHPGRGTPVPRPDPEGLTPWTQSSTPPAPRTRAAPSASARTSSESSSPA